MAKKNPNIGALLRIFLIPTLVIKSGIMFFGLNYSRYPDEGYGYGLAISVALIFIAFAAFLWTFRNYTE